jgi:hypothetical protein
MPQSTLEGSTSMIDEGKRNVINLLVFAGTASVSLTPTRP